jgi:hypothetical protein
MKLSSSAISFIGIVRAGALLLDDLIAAAALFAGPPGTNAQNPHKPTTSILKPRPTIYEARV